MFITSADGNLSKSLSAVELGRVSPQNKNDLISGIRSLLNSFEAKHILANDGVDTQTLALEFFKDSKRVSYLY